jgi:PHD/YefM family antitoxin component YafN of YafNO toxin-antitoxin module
MRNALRSVTIKGDKPLVVISAEQYESMMETIELLSINPDLAEELKAERRRMDKGEYITLSDYKKKYRTH